MRRRPLVLALSLALAALACTKAGKRPWRPSDHTQPPGIGADTPSGPSATESPGVVAARVGDALFRIHCASCHGAAGAGAAAGAPPGTPTLAGGAIAGRTDAELETVITSGRGAMPPFGGAIDEAGRAALVLYLRTLR